MMNFEWSHGFIQGSTHLVCEDYATSSTVAGLDLTVARNPLIIVSDGCSSADDTDVGARVVALAGRKVLAPLIASRKVLEPEALADLVLSQIRLNAVELGTPIESCVATLLAGFVLDGSCHVYAFGDGLWYYRSRAGVLHYTVIEADQKPPYLVGGPDECDIALIDPAGERVIHKKKWFHWSFRADTVSEFGIATDGICAVKQRDTMAVVEALSGDRIEYLINNFLDTHPYLYDDIGVAAIRIVD